MSEQRRLIIRTARGVDLETLRRVLAENNLRWAYAERMADTGLGTVADLLAGEPLGAPKEYVDPDAARPGVSLERWEHGRAFGPEMEVDWWREGKTFRLRVLSESQLPAGVVWTEPDGEAPVAQGTPRPMLLYGSHDDKSPQERPTWSETRIPRHLAHPISSDKPPRRVALLGQDYARAGAVVITRLIAVVPGDDVQVITSKEEAR
ncbi:MAG: hypothetical protein WHX52_21700 [Anaerolineae bacterium]